MIVALIGLPVIWLALMLGPAWAGEIRVAVTSSFFDTMTAVGEQFRVATSHQVLLTEASSGELYAQILNGAPFDVYLSSDQLDAKNLEDDGFAVPGTRFPYAVGRVTLWSPHPGRISENGMEILRQGGFRSLAISNPRTNGYGQAAVQALKAMGLWNVVQDRLVETENSRMAFQLVAGGKADLGLVPLGEVLDPDVKEKGSRWDVPERFHTPVRQEAVLLIHGKDNPAALDLLKFLRSGQARDTMQRFGYGIP